MVGAPPPGVRVVTGSVSPVVGGTERGRTRLLVVALAALALATSACEVAVDVGVDVAPDGSGTVQVEVAFDPEAAGRIELVDQLRTDDLERTGWMVAGPQRTDDGATVVTATKAFARSDDADEVLQEVSGAQGPLREFTLERRSSFLSTTFTFDGLVDLSAGVEGFGDEELRQALEGSGFSLERVDLEKAIGAGLEETFRFEVHTYLPGALRAGAPGIETADAVVWRPAVGEQVALSATSRLWHTERIIWLAIAALCALALVVVLVRNRRRRRQGIAVSAPF